MKKHNRILLLCAALLFSFGAINVAAQNQQSEKIPQATENNFNYDAESFGKTFAHRTAQVNGVKLHYVMGGKGDAVVLLHGFPTTWRAWRKVLPALAAKYTVIAPDLRGFGDSEKPAGGYDGRTLAEDIRQLVASLGFKRIYLVGHDMGAIPAYSYAAAYPDDVRRLVILEELIPGFGFEDLPKTAGVWHFGFHQASDNLAEQLTAGREKVYTDWFILRDVVVKGAFTEEDLSEFGRTFSQPGAMTAALAHYRAVPETVRQNKERGARKLRMPILALGGDGVLKDLPLKSLQRAGRNVRGGVLKNCGHYIAAEQPEELLRRLFEFFGDER